MTIQAIFQAAEKWDETALNSLLKQKPQLAKARDRLGRTAFDIAVARRYPKAIQAKLKKE